MNPDFWSIWFDFSSSA